MSIAKKQLSFEEIEAQTALELPDRETMLVTVVITNVLNNLSIDVDVTNNKIAIQVCAIVADINALLVDDTGASLAFLSCVVQQ
jgi:hypothetical protein